MSTSKQKIINIHSSVLNKQPKPEVLSPGELAVNNNSANEFISLLNSDGEVVRISNDLTQVERMEDKEVFPYEGKIDNVDLENNRSNIEIKLNQKAAKKMRHYDKVNDALDIDGQPINPSSDGGVTDGAGFSIDTSLFAMNGSNPSFKTLEVTCETNLLGTTNVKGNTADGCGSNFNINVTNVSGNVTNTTYEGDTITIVVPDERISACTNLDIKSDNVNLEQCGGNGKLTVKEKETVVSGSTLEINEGTSVDVKAPNATVSGTNLTVSETNTDVTSCGSLSVNSDNVNVEQCTANGKLTVKEKEAVVSGTSLNVTEENTDITSCGSFNLDSDNINIEQCGNDGKIAVKEKAAEISGSSLDITEEDTTLQSCGSITLKSDDVSVEECTEGQGSISFKFKDLCLEGSNSATLYGKNNTNVGVSCDESAASTTTTIKGNSIVESGNTISETATTSITEKASTINVNASTALNMSAPTTTLSGTNFNVTEANMNVTATTKVDVKSPTVSVSGTNLTVSETNTDVTSCGRFKVDSNAITLEECAAGQGTLTVKENTVDVSAKTITETASTSITEKAPTVNVSGTTTNITGATTLNLTGATINENGGIVNITSTGNTNVTAGNNVCIKASKDADLYGAQNTHVGTACDGSITPNIDMKGQTLVISGGTSTIYRNTTNTITANTVDGALEEVLRRSKVTISAVTNAAGDDTLMHYDLYQNYDGSNTPQKFGTINIPKDFLLKDALIVRGTWNGSTFTENASCTGTSCVWAMKLIWNVKDPETGHADLKTTYIDLSDLVKDIVADNGAANRGVNVTIWYDGRQQHISADTTVVIKNADGSGTKTFAKADGIHTLSAYTLNMTSGDVRSNSSLTNWTYDPFDKKVTVTTPTDVAHVNRNTLSVSYGDVKNAPNSTYDPGNGTANTVRNSSITIPNATKHLNKEAITFQSGSFGGGSYNTESAVTVNVPTDASHIANRSVSWTYGDVKNANGGSYSPAGSDVSFVIPKSTSDLNRKTLTWTNGAANTGSYDTTADKEIKIPSLLSHLDGGVVTNNDGCLSIDKDVCINGNVTAAHIYNSSDERLKENIKAVPLDEAYKARNVEIKSFNFKGEEGKTVGVIAQSVEKNGLDFCVIEGEDGYKKVDYTSLMLLKIAYLERALAKAVDMIDNLKAKIEDKQ